MPSRITVRDVWKAFKTSQRTLSVLEAINFTVEEGEFVALVGPSGCGKSTLLNVLAGFERPDRGEALVDGKPIEGPSRRGIMITQHGSVFPWMTVRRNLIFAAGGLSAEERKQLSRHYIELVGLGGFEDAYPWQLSDGMLQRVEVARALMAKPDILFMDEPFGALDALTRMRMRNELLRILARDQHTCLLVTHDVEEALHLADRILVLTARPGKVQCVIVVDVPQPRVMSSVRLVNLKEQVLRELGLSAADIQNDTSVVGVQWCIPVPRPATPRPL